MNFERQLEAIKSKDDLHKWIDERVDDDDRIVIITLKEDGGGRFFDFGKPTVATVVWMIESFKHWFMFESGEET